MQQRAPWPSTPLLPGVSAFGAGSIRSSGWHAPPLEPEPVLALRQARSTTEEASIANRIQRRECEQLMSGPKSQRSATRRWRVGRALRTAALVVAAACDGAAARAPLSATNDRITVVEGQAFDDVFVVVDTLILEESPSVVTVAPHVSIDSGGGFLVADPAEHQVRVYTDRGKLRQVFGQGTDRVDSIKSPGRAQRLSNGGILVVNLQGPVTLIPGRLAEPSTFISESLLTARGVEQFDTGEILVVGSDSSPPSATLFHLDLARRRITAGFFPPPGHLDKWVTAYMSAVRTARRGDRIAAVHMLSDTLVIFDRLGRELSRIRIPIDPFVVPTGPLPNLKTVAERYAWLAPFTMVMDVFWLDEGDVVVQWAKAIGNGLVADMGVLQMDTAGTRIWAIAPSPVLVAVRGRDFFFREPNNKAPNRWMIAHRR